MAETPPNLQVSPDGGAAAPAVPAGSTATGAPSGSAGPAKPWYDGKLTDELIGHIDNKGWKRDDPIAVAVEATKAARELQKHFGVPEDRLVKLPGKPDDEAGWNSVYQRLGAPAQAKDYDLSTVKFSDGSELKDLPGFEDAMRGALYAAHVAKDKAADIVKSVVKFMDGAEATMGAASQAQRLENEKMLRAQWGHNFEFNRLTALQGARRAGLQGQEGMKSLEALESLIGYPGVMELFRKIGAHTNEDMWVEGAQVGHPVTQQGAVARRAELMKDQDFVNRYLRGEKQARDEMNNLIELISGEVAA